MNVIPIRTKFANRVDAYEKGLAEAIPKLQERAQAIVDAQAFLEFTALRQEDSAEWDEFDLAVFVEECVAQSGQKAGEARFANLMCVLELLKSDSDLY